MNERTTLNAKRKNFEVQAYSRLIGKTVSAICDGGEFLGLKFTDGTVAWVSSDQEGNAPGWLDIVNFKKSSGTVAKNPAPAISEDEEWDMLAKGVLAAARAVEAKTGRKLS